MKNEMTVTQFINYFGGGTYIVIEPQETTYEYYWRGLVDEWLNEPIKDFKNRKVLGSTVTDNKLYIRI